MYTTHLHRVLLQGLAPHFVPKGTLEKWKEVFNMYDRPGLEVQAFAALSGFGSPLLALTGQKGCSHKLNAQFVWARVRRLCYV